jgi:hypothetical protein
LEPGTPERVFTDTATEMLARMPDSQIRKGRPSVKLTREEFSRRYRSRFADPAFQPLDREIEAIVAAAWDAYSHSRKAPHTRKAGPGFSDPDYEIAVDWLAARDAILEAQRRHDDTGQTPRVLIVNGSSRSEHTCPAKCQRAGVSSRSPNPCSPKWDLQSTCWTCRERHRSSASRFTLANPASPHRWRSVTGPAAVIPITHWDRPTTG